MNPKPRRLTEEMPETPDELEERDLELEEGKIVRGKPEELTEELPGGNLTG